MAYNFIDGHGGYYFHELIKEIDKFDQHDIRGNFYNRAYIQARESIDWISPGNDIEQKIQFLIDWKTDYVRIHRKEYHEYFRKLADNKNFISILLRYINIDLPNIDLSNQNIKTDISYLYGLADNALKPTSASKVMHMFNPNLFPIWDQKMRENLYPSNGHNPSHYVRWMTLLQNELNFVIDHLISEELSKQEAIDMIKQLDTPTCCLLRIMDKINYNNSRTPLEMPSSEEITSENDRIAGTDERIKVMIEEKSSTRLYTLHSRNELAILAPVPRTFLNTAISYIYPTHKKVSFGANKIEEMQTIRNDYLKAKNYQENVFVYIYVNGRAQYRSVLVDEFLFYPSSSSSSRSMGIME